ncbi:MAG: efflux RND transporter periplasmic adaptor subunit [Saprospiraceae bacterium]|nr:efflux RND transporter periplasmic adaptor subunit [Saprospiraceae bacterium]
MIFQNKLYKINFVSVMLFTGLLWGCGQKSQQAEETNMVVEVPTSISLTPEQFKNAGIKLESLKLVPMATHVKLKGQIETPPQQQVSVSAPLGGYVRSIKWLPGMRVSAGQVLAVLEDNAFIQLQQDFLLASSRYFYAEKELNRQKQLMASSATSERQLAEAEQLVQTKRIEVNALRQKLKLIHIDGDKLKPEQVSSRINLYAPVNGYIGEVSANLGKYVQPSDELLTLIADGNAIAVLKAFEKDVAYIKSGQEVILYTNDRPEMKYQSKVVHVGRQISGEGYAKVICSMNSKLQTMLAGQYISAEVIAGNFERSCVPDIAVVHYEGKDYVYTEKRDRTFEMVEVKTGIKDDGMLEIINAPSLEGKKVVTTGSYTLLMAMKNVAE